MIPAVACLASTVATLSSTFFIYCVILQRAAWYLLHRHFEGEEPIVHLHGKITHIRVMAIPGRTIDISSGR